MKGVQCYELFGGIAHKNKAFLHKNNAISPVTEPIFVSQMCGTNSRKKFTKKAVVSTITILFCIALHLLLCYRRVFANSILLVFL